MNLVRDARLHRLRMRGGLVRHAVRRRWRGEGIHQPGTECGERFSRTASAGDVPRLDGIRALRFDAAGSRQFAVDAVVTSQIRAVQRPALTTLPFTGTLL